MIYFKYGKSPKSGYYSKYNREFIDDYNVEVIDYLMNRGITEEIIQKYGIGYSLNSFDSIAKGLCKIGNEILYESGLNEICN